MIGWNISHHFLNQSGVNPKPIASCSHAFSRAWHWFAIGWSTSRHFLSQSGVNLKPTVPCSHTLSRAWHRFVIGWIVSGHFLNQSGVNPKPIVSCSHVFPRALYFKLWWLRDLIGLSPEVFTCSQIMRTLGRLPKVWTGRWYRSFSKWKSCVISKFSSKLITSGFRTYQVRINWCGWID